MRILQLLSQTQPTGAESYAVLLSEWLAQHGHEVIIASDRLHTPTTQTFVPLLVHDQRLKTRIQSTLFLRKFLREQKIQVIHCHSRAAARLAYWATRGTSVAVVSTLHGRQPASFSKRVHDIYGNKCISICENLTAQLIDLLKMNPRKIKRIRNPIATSSLEFVTELPRSQRLAWIGRFTGPKGERAQQFISEVLPSLLKDYPQISIDFIGGDPALLGERTLRQVSTLKTEFGDRIRIENHRPQLDKELAQYQLVFAAGRIAMTSLLCGIPTVAVGEYCYEGLVTTSTLTNALASNFGDIGADGRAMAAVDFDHCLAEIKAVLNSETALPLAERQSLREQMHSQFDLPIVARNILNVYKSAYFLKQRPSTVPVLMYHKVPSETLNSKHRIFVTAATFEQHLKFFKEKGFTTLNFADLEAFRSGERDFSEFPQKPLVLTFDDGYVDNLRNAGPLLKKYDLKAVIYLLADHSLNENAWDLYDDKEPAHALMTLQEKRELKDFNFEIGSHGFRHQKITEMTLAEAKHELRASKEKLESDLQTKIYSYAFTYGVTTEPMAELAEEAGYQFAVNTDSGGLHLEENPFAIFRANIFPEDGPAQLRKKTASWYRRYFYIKRGR